MIPLSSVEVLNPRERNAHAFEEIVRNIKLIGLKKPIVVAARPATDDGDRYVLVCGEGRLKAFKALGETQIPALVIDVPDEDAFIMSLTENIARRQWRPLELLAGIEQLTTQGGLSEKSCVRHSMSTRSMNATQDEDNRASGQGGAAAILGRGA